MKGSDCWNFQNWCFLEKVKVFDLKQGRKMAAGEKILSLPETEPLMSQLGKNRIFITTIVGRIKYIFTSSFR